MNIDMDTAVPRIIDSAFVPPPIDAHIGERPITEEGRDAFQLFFQAARDVVNETSQNLNRADTLQMNFATGQETNMLTVILAQERANSTLNFTTQITNRIIEAYREIMRMQV
jgi:flagellar hook-basal body complex protein FliE